MGKRAPAQCLPVGERLPDGVRRGSPFGGTRGFPEDSSVIRRVLFKEPGDASAGVPELLGILVQDI